MAGKGKKSKQRKKPVKKLAKKMIKKAKKEVKKEVKKEENTEVDRSDVKPPSPFSSYHTGVHLLRIGSQGGGQPHLLLKINSVRLSGSPNPPIDPSRSQTAGDAFGPFPFHVLEPN